MEEQLTIGKHKVKLKYRSSHRDTLRDEETFLEGMCCVIGALMGLASLASAVYFFSSLGVAFVGVLGSILLTVLLNMVLNKRLCNKIDKEEREVLEAMRSDAILKLLN